MGLGLGKEWIMLAKGTISRVALGQGSATAAGVAAGHGAAFSTAPETTTTIWGIKGWEESTAGDPLEVSGGTFKKTMGWF